MLSDRPLPASLTVELCDGRSLNGRITHFSPYAPNVTLDAEFEGLSAPKRLVLSGDSMTHIAFRAVKGAPAPERAPGLKRHRIHLASRKSVLVELDPQRGESPLGFYAFPTERAWDVREYFFYSQAVLRRELDEPIGEMLIQDGAIDASAVAKGIDAQTAERKKTIGDILVERSKVQRDQVEEAAAVQERKKLKIGEVLIEAGLATEEDIQDALREQAQNKNKRLGEILMGMGIIKEIDLTRALARKFNLPLVDLDENSPQQSALALVPRHLVEGLGVLPIYSDSMNLIIAIGDPLEFQAAEAVRMVDKKRLTEVLVAPSQLKRYVEQALAFREPAALAAGPKEEVVDILKGLEDENVGADTTQDKDEKITVESTSGVVRLVNKIIVDGYRRGASDVHFEPNGNDRPMTVRFRVDGDCVKYIEVPAALRLSCVARCKIMANLDISERRKPQDGKIRFRIGDTHIELRVATLPTAQDNEDVVMRILATTKPQPLGQMGMSERNLRELKVAMKKSYGLILCVGPTGSGKTTTLHAVLADLNEPEMKIWTAEDPVEIMQFGLRQVQVNPKIGYTFEAAMRSFLRADPDIIMVGEMRDAQTAGIAVEASLTGHLVMSTLHTNSAPETITRLLDMGLEPFSFADALVAVLAQRLARILCQSCKRPHTPSEAEFAAMVNAYGKELWDQNIGITEPADTQMFGPRGCTKCDMSGYKGRAALHELLIANDEMRALVAAKAPMHKIRGVAVKGGMTTLIQDGIQKVLTGLTDMKQVLAVCAK